MLNRIFLVLLVMILVTTGLGSLGFAVAQTQSPVDLYDFNDDGRVTCNGDFEPTFPDTYTEEATAAMRRFPDELDNLDRDDDGVACESPDSSPGGPSPEPTAAPNQPTPTPTRPTQTPAAPTPTPVRPSTTASDSSCGSTFVSNGRVEICAGQYVRVTAAPGASAGSPALQPATTITGGGNGAAPTTLGGTVTLNQPAGASSVNLEQAGNRKQRKHVKRDRQRKRAPDRRPASQQANPTSTTR